MGERVAITNQYRCIRLDMLESMLVDNNSSIERNKLSSAPQEYIDRWVTRLESDNSRIQEGIDQNIWKE